MSFNEDDPEHIDTLRAIRDAVIVGDDVQAERLAEPLKTTDSLERTVVAAMDRVRYEAGTYNRFTGGLIRWLRRAAADDQTWAIARIGVEWWPQLALSSRSRDRQDVTAEPAIEEDEAERCVAIAAARGHRRAAFRHGSLESLLTAYGDGTPDELIDTNDLRSIEARIATLYADAEDPKADGWFRRAVASPRWEDDDGDATWVSAMSAYALWAHRSGEIVLCEQISARAIDDAVIEGAADRCAIAADAHKPYRYSYCLATSNEAARWRAMEHLLTDHAMSPDGGLELLRLLSRNHFFGQKNYELVAAVWARKHGPVRDADAVESLAWEMIGWLLTEVVPGVLQVLGCDDHAGRIQDALASVDFASDGFWEPTIADSAYIRELAQRYWGFGEPLDDVTEAEYLAQTASHSHPLDGLIDELIAPRRATGWEAVCNNAANVSPHCRRDLLRLAHPLQRMGLYGVQSAFETGLRPRVSEDEDRLLASSDAWLAMWLATSTPPPEGWNRILQWSDVWDRISPMITDYLVSAATIAAGQRCGDFVDDGLPAKYDALEATVARGVRERLAAIISAATNDFAEC